MSKSADSVKRYVDEYLPNNDDRRCHQCQRAYSKEGMVEALMEDSVVVQSFTGRVFCEGGCWEKYLENEGLS